MRVRILTPKTMTINPDKYPSKYSNGKQVTPAQFITEMICERKALIDKVDLHYKFWTQKYWAMFYRNQIASANKLVKKYDPKAIIRALQTAQGKKIYSLRAPHLIAIIEQQAANIAQEAKNKAVSIDRTTNKTFGSKEIHPKNNIISRLKGLDQ